MSLFIPKDIPYTDELNRTKFILIWRISLVGFLVLSFLTILFINSASSAKWTYLISAGIAGLGLAYLHFSKKFEPVFLFYAIVGSCILHIDSNINFDTPHHANFLWIILFIVIAFFGAGIKLGFVIFSLNAIAIFYYSQFSLQHYFEVPKNWTQSNTLAIGLEMIVTIFFSGYVMYMDIKARNNLVSELMESNNALEKTNQEVQKRSDENEILVKEIHHRVKNNLQIIISLLRLQMTDVKTKESQVHFAEAVNRIMVMSGIHEKLYQQNNLTRFKIDEYIQDLAHELKLFFVEDKPVNINVFAEVDKIDLKTIVPLGLILNELISNSFKYAFKSNDSGEINIDIYEENNDIVLGYSDNGAWKKQEVQGGFGLELIEILTEQLNGNQTVRKEEKGTFYNFRLKPDLHEKK